MIPRYLPASLARTLTALVAPMDRGEWWPALVTAPPRSAELTCSATDALIFCLRALGPPGSVIVPAYTCPQLLAAIEAMGERLHPVDIDPETGTFAPEALAHALGAPRKAIVLTHLFGRACDREGVIAIARQRGIAVIEDSALLVDPSAPVEGSAARVFSFGRGKPLAFGGGGALLLFDAALAARYPPAWAPAPVQRGALRLALGALRDGRLGLALAGWRARPESRPAAGPAGYAPAIPSPRFRRVLVNRLLGGETGRRGRITRSAIAALEACWPGIASAARRPGWRIPAGAVIPALPLRVRRRDEVRAHLAAIGIDCPRYWTEADFGSGFLDPHPGARSLARSLLFLPLRALGKPSLREALARVLARHAPEAFA